MIASLPSTEWRRFALFLAAGALNTVFGYAAFAFFVWIGTGNDWAVLCGTVAGVVFNFNTFSRVFAAQGLSRMPHFLVLHGVLTVANIVLLRTASYAGLNPYAGEALVVMLIAPCSFFAMRRFVFPTSDGT